MTPEEAARALALGLLHGPLELLPVSSSAHAVLLGAPGKEFEVALHGGAALALRPWPEPVTAVLGVAPPALAGLLFERAVEARLGTPKTIAAGLLAGSAALLAANRRSGTRVQGELSPAEAVLLGLAQACALWPGVSRTAAVLAAARALGFSREAAWRLSRTTAVPVLAAATALKAFRLARRGAPAARLAELSLAAVASAGSTAVARRGAARWERLPWELWAGYRVALAARLVLNRAR